MGLSSESVQAPWPPGQAYPILTSYLNYTFLRLQQLDRIAYSADESRACFNTGLQTPNEKDIYVTFFRNRQAGEKDQPTWNMFGFFDSYSERLGDFRPLLEIATYVDNPADLVFDTSYQFEINFNHIFDQSRDRLPEILRDNRTLAVSAIQGSVQLLKQKIVHNYKIAIPHWHEGRIQLLLPLNLTGKRIRRDTGRRQGQRKTHLPDQDGSHHGYGLRRRAVDHTSRS